MVTRDVTICAVSKNVLRGGAPSFDKTGVEQRQWEVGLVTRQPLNFDKHG